VIEITENFSPGNFIYTLIKAWDDGLIPIPKVEKPAGNLLEALKTFTKPVIQNRRENVELQGLQELVNLVSYWLVQALGYKRSSQEGDSVFQGYSGAVLAKWTLLSENRGESEEEVVNVRGPGLDEHWDSEEADAVENKAYIALKNNLLKRGHRLGANLFRTSKGFFGFGPMGRNDSSDCPPAVQIGDHISVFPTLTMPMALRRANDDTYVLVGRARVGNIMEIPWFEGEARKPSPLRIC